MKIQNSKLRKYLWFAIFLTNIVAILMLLGATQAWYFLPSKMPIFSFLGMAFPVLFVVNIMYLIFWIFTLKWQYALAEIIVLLFCWTPMHTYMPTHSPVDHLPQESFKILTYNVRQFNLATGKEARENPIFNYILEQEPDIICLQEFAVAEKKTSKGLISKIEVDKIFKDYPYRDILRVGNQKSPTIYGLAIYSKFPILATGAVPLWSTYNGCVIHQLNIKGKKVLLANTHLESNRITSDDKKLYSNFLKSDKNIKLKDVTRNIKSKLSVAFTIREEQTQKIKAYLSNMDADATIICGDFNDTPISYTYNTMKGDLIDSFVSTGRGIGVTYHENMFWFRIDYVFHSINIKSYNTTVGDQKYSDHYPVWTNLMFK